MACRLMVVLPSADAYRQRDYLQVRFRGSPIQDIGDDPRDATISPAGRLKCDLVHPTSGKLSCEKDIERGTIELPQPV